MCASKFIKVAFALSTKFVQKHWATASIDHLLTEITHAAQTCGILVAVALVEQVEQVLRLPSTSI